MMDTQFNDIEGGGLEIISKAPEMGDIAKVVSREVNQTYIGKHFTDDKSATGHYISSAYGERIHFSLDVISGDAYTGDILLVLAPMQKPSNEIQRIKTKLESMVGQGSTKPVESRTPR